MASGRNPFMDSRRISSSSYSSLTVVLFISICLFGFWMISNSIVPVEVPLTQNNLEIRHEASETKLRNRDVHSVGVPDGSSGGKSNDNPKNFSSEIKPVSVEDQDVPDRTDESTVEKVQNGELIKGRSVAKEDVKYNNSRDTAEMISQVTYPETTDNQLEKKAETFGDENGNMEGAEMSKEGDAPKVGGDDNVQEKSTDESSRETPEKKSDDAGDGNGKMQGLEEISRESTRNSSDDAGNGNGKTQGADDGNDKTVDGTGKTQGGEESSLKTTENSSDDVSDRNGKLQGEEVNPIETAEKSTDVARDGNAKTQGGEESFLKTTEKSSDDPSGENVKTQGEVSSQETTDSDQQKKGDQENNETTEDDQDKNPDQQNPDDSSVKVKQKLDDSAVMGDKMNDQVYDEVLPQSELLNETNTQYGAWSTQATESKNEKKVQAAMKKQRSNNWKLCNVYTGVDYIPCLDNGEAIEKLMTTKHYKHRERRCPDQGPTCLVPNPQGYRKSIEWPNSRKKIWYNNVPHNQLASVKGHQNWVKLSGEFLTFPGGGTQFKHGALHYIDFIEQSAPDIAWGNKSRVVLDVGCGVANFGGYLFDRDTLTMSFGPKDEHEAQVQFALERGIPAFLAAMGTKRLPFPGMVFDVIHCARCRVPWHIEGGVLLLELNRLLRPGGYFIWSATPTYRKLSRDVEIWKEMSKLTKSMCWEMMNRTKDRLHKVGMAIYRKPSNNECYAKRMTAIPPLCRDSDDPNAAWNISLQQCMHRVPEDPAARGSKWPEMWPQRLTTTPYWLDNSQLGVYGKHAPEDFQVDLEHWKRVVINSYLNGIGIKWSSVRNVMDMRAVYGGFAAALREARMVKNVDAWVMNVVSIDAPDTLHVIYERGLFGIYHNWCESFSTYPRSYDLLHADHLLSKLKHRCKLLSVIAEMDRILRPKGYFIIRDNVETLKVVERMVRSLNYKIMMTFSKENEGLLCARKTVWRPKEVDSAPPTDGN